MTSFIKLVPSKYSYVEIFFHSIQYILESYYEYILFNNGSLHKLLLKDVCNPQPITKRLLEQKSKNILTSLKEY